MNETESYYNRLEIPKRPTWEWLKPWVEKIYNYPNQEAMKMDLSTYGINTDEQIIDLKGAIEEVKSRRKKSIRGTEIDEQMQLCIYRCWSLIPEENRKRIGGAKLPDNIWDTTK